MGRVRGVAKCRKDFRVVADYVKYLRSKCQNDNDDDMETDPEVAQPDNTTCENAAPHEVSILHDAYLKEMLAHPDYAAIHPASMQHTASLNIMFPAMCPLTGIPTSICFGEAPRCAHVTQIFCLQERADLGLPAKYRRFVACGCTPEGVNDCKMLDMAAKRLLSNTEIDNLQKSLEATPCHACFACEVMLCTSMWDECFELSGDFNATHIKSLFHPKTSEVESGTVASCTMDVHDGKVASLPSITDDPSVAFCVYDNTFNNEKCNFFTVAMNRAKNLKCLGCDGPSCVHVTQCKSQCGESNYGQRCHKSVSTPPWLHGVSLPESLRDDSPEAIRLFKTMQTERMLWHHGRDLSKGKPHDEVRVLTHMGTFRVKVPQCNSKPYYSGLDNGCLRISKSAMIDLSILYGCRRSLQTSMHDKHKYYKELCESIYDESCLTYHEFLIANAYFCNLTRERKSYWQKGFCCPICEKNGGVKTVCIDVTKQGCIKWDQLNNVTSMEDYIDELSQHEGGAIKCAKPRSLNECCLAANHEVRRLFSQLAGAGRRHKNGKVVYWNGLLNESVKRMYSLMWFLERDCTYLYAIFQHILNHHSVVTTVDGKEYIVCKTQHWKWLAAELGKASDGYQLIYGLDAKTEFGEFCDNVFSKSRPNPSIVNVITTNEHLSRHAPIVMNMLSIVGTEDNEVPEYFKGVLQRIRCVSSVDLYGAEDGDSGSTGLSDESIAFQNKISVGYKFGQHGWFFPNHIINKRLVQLPVDMKDGHGCFKKDHQPNKLWTPGLLLCCCRHGVILGYSLLTEPESLKHVFHVLYNLFTDAPTRVIYDNACHLQRYCMRRCPYYFRETQFVVDRYVRSVSGQCSLPF